MQDASTPCQRFSRVCRDFETSRLEKTLLAAAYERAVPTASRRPKRHPSVPSLGADTNGTTVDTDFPAPFATERQAG